MDQCSRRHCCRKICRLIELPQHTRATVCKLKIAAEEIDRLQQLGLHQGSTVEIVHGAVNDSILLAVGDGRIGVNYEIASRIYVF